MLSSPARIELEKRKSSFGEKEVICTHVRLRRVLGSLSMIDLEKGEIDSETETEVDFTHFRSIESLWIIVNDRSRKGKQSFSDREVNRTQFSQGESSDHRRRLI